MTDNKEQQECTCKFLFPRWLRDNDCPIHGRYRALYQPWVNAGAKSNSQDENKQANDHIGEVNAKVPEPIGQPEKQGEEDIELQYKFSRYKQDMQQQISFRDSKISELESELSAAKQRIEFLMAKDEENREDIKQLFEDAALYKKKCAELESQHQNPSLPMITLFDQQDGKMVTGKDK